MKLRKSELILLTVTALFILLAGVYTAGLTAAPDSTLVKTDIPAPIESTDIYETAEPIGLVNINTADEFTLSNLPGIGPELARRIILWRENNGPFQSPEDIMNVSGIGEKTYAAMEGLIICQEDDT